MGEFPSKTSLMRGKENECLNLMQDYSKSAVTNHSFNGFFNENTHKPKMNINESINKRP